MIMETMNTDNNQQLETQLFDAVTQDEKQKVQDILKQQPELINFVFENEKSVFELAVEHGYSSLAKELIKFPDFDLNLSEHNPLRISIVAGYEDIATILLEKGANPNHYKEKSGSILWLCLENGYFELAEKLLSCGAEIDVRDEKGWTILIYAAYNGLEKIVDFLLEHNASVNIRNNDGWSAIVGAYAMNKISIVEKLKNHGAKFNEKYSQAALLNSAVNGHLQIAKLLVEQGVNPNISDKNHGSLLHIATLKRDYDFIQSLLEKGANPNIKDNDGNPPIDELARNGCDELIKLFVQHGADVNLTNNNNQTPIITAAMHNQIETVQLLCDLGANINHQGNKGNTALMFAVWGDYTNMVKKLMELGANPELVDNVNKKASAYIKKFSGEYRGNRYHDAPNPAITSLLKQKWGLY